MPSRNTNSERFALFDTPESSQQRKVRLANAQQNAAMTQSVIAERAAREEQRVRSLSRRIKSNMLSLSDLMGGMGPIPLSRSDVMQGMNEGSQFLTEEFPTSQDDVIMEDMYRQPSQRQVQQPIRRNQQPQQRQTLTEQRPVKRQQQPELNLRQFIKETPTENWRVKRYLGETRSGEEVHVWKVENAKTGNSLRNLFRIEGVASRIAMILNESGNLNDSRIVSLVNAYEKRDKMLKEARALEKTVDGKEMKSERLRALRAEINQLDYRLGV